MTSQKKWRSPCETSAIISSRDIYPPSHHHFAQPPAPPAHPSRNTRQPIGRLEKYSELLDIHQLRFAASSSSIAGIALGGPARTRQFKAKIP